MIFRCLQTFIVLGIVYMIFAILDSTWGIDGLVGLVLFHPIAAALVSSVTVALCCFVGWVMGKALRRPHWWRSALWPMLALAGTGVLLLIAANLPIFRETALLDSDGITVPRSIPNGPLVGAGWIALAFGLTHAEWWRHLFGTHPPPRREA